MRARMCAIISSRVLNTHLIRTIHTFVDRRISKGEAIPLLRPAIHMRLTHFAEQR